MKTRLIVLFAALVAALLCTGCSSIPNVVSVEQLEYTRTDPAGGTTITAKNVKLKDGKLSVEDYTRETHYPSFNQSIKLKGAEFAKAEDLVK